MGRIKTTMIKKTALQLMQGEHNFKTDFMYNKKILKGTMPSKSIQNKVAGYISRLKKMETKPKPQPKIQQAEDNDRRERYQRDY